MDIFMGPVPLNDPWLVWYGDSPARFIEEGTVRVRVLTIVSLVEERLALLRARCTGVALLQHLVI